MNSIKEVKQHINKLMQQDKQDADNIDNFYNDALNIIKNHLQAFYTQYANDNQLKSTDLMGQVNSWDLTQFKTAINQLMLKIDDSDRTDDFNKRMIVAQMKSRMSRTNLLSGLVTAGFATATLLAMKYGNNKINQQYIDEYQYMSGNKINSKDLPKDIIDDDLNKKIWNNNDLSSIRVTQTINDNINKGIDKVKLNKMLSNNNGKPLANNIDSSAQAGISFTKGNFNYNIINANNTADFDFFKSNDAVYLKWITQEDRKVCIYCKPKDGNIYRVDKAPTPQVDTHNHCRCTLVQCDKYGNLV